MDNNFEHKAKQIRALIFDIDGVLTDGSIIYSTSHVEIKSFNVKDGQIIKHLRNNDILVGAITGRSSSVVERRCKELNLDFFYQGTEGKWSKIAEIIKEYNLTKEQVCYVGDDLIDIKAIKEVGLGACPKDALPYVKAEADYVCSSSGGQGVVRELGDLILQAQNKLDQIIDEYKLNG